ncbi:MAG: hypothetical protein KF819_25525 [Labilithrix sp.]|nr:hypothetical protein [Labilithrix sp.]
MRREPDAAVEPDDPAIDRAVRERQLVAGYRAAARRALELARRYRAEEGAAGGDRERACITQARIWRSAVRDLRAGIAVAPRPGLARALPEREDRSRETG